MVTETLRSAIKAEHEIEHLADSADGSSKDVTELELQQLKHFTEQAAISAAKAAENWGRNAINKTKEITEDITL